MKTKLEMAHEFMMKKMETETIDNHWELFYTSWRYADAMQAEADKRNKTEAEQKRKAVREMLNADNTFLEKEGQHFDDMEWQPDWSQAPDNNVQYFAVDEDGRCGWYVSEPELCSDHWYWSGRGERKPAYDDAPSFGYTGDWRNSLRKRPQ